MQRFPAQVVKHPLRSVRHQTVGPIGNADRIDVHFELGREPEVEAVGHEDVLVAPDELVGELPDPGQLAPLFWR